MSVLAQNIDSITDPVDAPQALTDGFHLVIDALKLNGINTIYGVPGIPITDLGPHSAGRRHARHFVPSRAERRPCSRHRGLPDQKDQASASRYRLPASSTG